MGSTEQVSVLRQGAKERVPMLTLHELNSFHKNFKGK